MTQLDTAQLAELTQLDSAVISQLIQINNSLIRSTDTIRFCSH